MKSRFCVLTICVVCSLFAGCYYDPLMSGLIPNSEDYAINATAQASNSDTETGRVLGINAHLLYNKTYAIMFALDFSAGMRTVYIQTGTHESQYVVISPAVVFEYKNLWVHFGYGLLVLEDSIFADDIKREAISALDVAWVSQNKDKCSLLIGLRMEHGNTIGSSVGLVVGGKF